MLAPVHNWRNTGRDGFVVVPFMGGLGFYYECAFPELSLASARAALDQLFPTLDFDNVAASDPFLWASSAWDVECVPLEPNTVEAWGRAWTIFRIWNEWKRENLAALKQRCRLCLTVVGFLVRPVFPFHVISKERAWSLLHGAHPPRHDAGIPMPAFAVS